MDISWKNNKLGKKIFKFGLGMYIIFSILVYFVIYGGIPILYKYYRTNDFNSKINYVINNSSTQNELSSNLADLRTNSNINVTYIYRGVKYSCFLGDDCRAFAGGDTSELPKDSDPFNKRQDFLSRTEYLKINDDTLTINFHSALSSTKEVQNILFMFLPIFGIISVTMALLLAYFISSYLSKSIVSLRNDAKKITSLQFDIEQSVTTDDELGDLSYSLVILADTLAKTLYDLQDANAKLNDDIEKERIREEERRAYIATLSHDLKTPLTAIKGQLEGMLYNIGKYKDHDTYLKKNIELTVEMENMIQSIIISSKLDDYNTDLHTQNIVLKECITDTIDQFEYTIADKKLEIMMKLNHDYDIDVDISLFGKAMNNIIGNAIEYATKESEIDIVLDQDILTISNETTDFDEALIDEGLIYKPFYRQDKSRNTRGSGLGMYIAKKIFEKHDIDIDLEYKDSRFYVKLNLDKVKEKL